MACKLIIFDCDGVLVDSEVIGNTVLAEVVTEAGWPMGVDKAMQHFKGLSSQVIWARVQEYVGKPLRHDIEEHFRRHQLAALAQHVKAVDGVHETLDALTVPFCVASNAPQRTYDSDESYRGFCNSQCGTLQNTLVLLCCKDRERNE